MEEEQSNLNPYVESSFMENAYSEWEDIRKKSDQLEGYAPFGKYGEEPIQGAPSMQQIWPDEAHIGQEYMIAPPQGRPLTSEHEDRLKDPLKYSDDLICKVEFIEKLGKGYFGEVWKVNADYRRSDIEPFKRRQFACKITRSEYLFHPNSVYEQMTDMLILRYLRHDNICNICGFIGIPDRVTGFPYAVVCTFLQLCDGNFQQIYSELKSGFAYSLYGVGKNVKEKFILPELLSKHWFTHIVKALEYIHRNNVVHLDIKRDNILFQVQYSETEDKTIKKEGKDKFLSSIFKLADFGCAKFKDPTISKIESENFEDAKKMDITRLYSILTETCITAYSKPTDRMDYKFRKYCDDSEWSEEYPSEWKNFSPDFKSLIIEWYTTPTKNVSDILDHNWFQN